jgi:hypothetical protein
MKQPGRSCLAAAFLAVAAVSVAQVAPDRPSRGPRPIIRPDVSPPPTVVPPRAEPPRAPSSFNSLEDAVASYAKGRPVPVVVFTGAERPSVSLKAPIESLALPQALHTIAAGATNSNRPVPGGVPNAVRVYRAGGVYTFGPEFAVAFNLDISKKPLLNCISVNTACGLLLRSLTKEQLAVAGSDGLGFSAMTPTQQALWRSVLSVPYTLSRRVPAEGGGVRMETLGDGPRTLNPESVRLRVVPSFASLQFRREGPSGPTQQSVPLNEAAIAAMPNEGFTHSIDYRLNYDLAERVAMKEKPSDLPEASPAMSKPLGKTGSLRMNEFLPLVNRTTGLRFLAPSLDDNATVWLGASSITALDALRAVAVANNATWRRSGQLWFLSDSLAGAAAESLTLRENAAQHIRDLDRLSESIGGWSWTDITGVLRADQSVAPGPTPEQMAAYVAADNGDDEVDPKRFVRFREMTPAQQEAVRARVRDQKVYDPMRQAQVPVDETMLAGSRVTHITLGLYADIRGVGTVMLRDGAMDLSQARYQRAAGPPAARPSEPPAPARVRLQHTMRAVMVPPLDAGDWDRLIAEMPKRGLNALYVPVLWDGKTMFPTPLFPSQSGRSEDTLAYVSQKARAAGIRVVGVINVLTWRNPSAEPHWLDRNLGWVDLDALGRGRRRWALKYPHLLAPAGASIPEWQRDPLLLADYVNPRVPEVRSKLVGLAQALRKYTALSAVALAHWSRGPYNRQDPNPALPPLGYHPLSREAFAKAYQADPLDLATVVRAGPAAVLDPFARRGYGYEMQSAWSRRLLMEDRMLFQAILAELEQTWDGDVEGFAGPLGRGGYMDETSRPIADRVIVPGPSGGGQDATLAVAPPASIPGLFVRDRRERLETFARDVQSRAYGYGPNSGIILDFTGSPDLLWDGLALIEKGE